jgi:CheY-like chemotaxis protein
MSIIRTTGLTPSVSRSTSIPPVTEAEQLLAYVSHELNGPVSAILGWTRLLMDDRLSPAERPRALRLIQHSARLQNRLAKDLKDASALTSGQLSVYFGPIDNISDLVNEVVETCRFEAADKQIVIKVSAHGRVRLVGDADRLHQAIHNVVANAVKFTPPGGRIDVTCASDGIYAEVAVCDTGVGVTPAEAARLFEPFWRGFVTPDRAGMGLGLAVAKQITDLHGGSLGVTSEGRDRGATFTLRLPLLPPTSMPRYTKASMPAPPPSGSSVPPIHVLLVEDDAGVRHATARLLLVWGYDVHAVGSPGEAVDAFQRRPVDIVLCDLGLWPGTGFQLLDTLRSTGARPCPIVAMSGAGQAAADRALSRGFSAYLEKPVDEAELLSAIQLLTDPMPLATRVSA